MLPTPSSPQASRDLLDVLIRAGLITVLVLFCFQIFRPFLNLMLWSMILAVTLYPLQRRLRHKGRLGGRDGRIATLIIFIAIVILLVPIYLLSASIVGSVDNALDTVRGGNFHIRPPAESVANWPLVGKPVHESWQQASTDMNSLVQKFMPQIKSAPWSCWASSPTWAWTCWCSSPP